MLVSFEEAKSATVGKDAILSNGVTTAEFFDWQLVQLGKLICMSLTGLSDGPVVAIVLSLGSKTSVDFFGT